MKILLRSLTLATVVFSPAAHASAPLFSAAPLTDTELDEARGGFTLPGGATFDIGAIISTTINGVKVLVSQLNFNSNGVTGAVQTGGGVQAEVSGVGNIAQTVTGNVQEAVDDITAAVGDLVGALGGINQSDGEGSTGATVVVNNGSPPTTSAPTIVDAVVPPTIVGDIVTGATDLATTPLVNAGDNISAGSNITAPQNAAATPTPIQTALTDAPAPNVAPPTAPGTGSSTAGTINVPASSTTVDDANYLTSTVQMADLLVKHSMGSNISSLVINTANNRVIDTQVAVNLRLDNVQPLSIGSIGFRVDALGIDASQWRAGR